MKTYTAEELLSPANADLVEQIALLLSHTFVEDPGHKWLLGTSSRKTYIAVTPDYLRFIVSLALTCGATTTIVTKDELPSSTAQNQDAGNTGEPRIVIPESHTVKAVCMTVPPEGNAKFDSTLIAIRAGALSLPFKCGFGLLWRILTTWSPMLDGMVEKMFPNPATRNHNWYLFYLAVHSDCQGQGIGKKLLLDIQDRVKQSNVAEHAKAEANNTDFESAALYLESSTLDSRRLYLRMGFEEMCTGTYGTIDEGEHVRYGNDGAVVGGRQYGLVWQSM